MTAASLNVPPAVLTRRTAFGREMPFSERDIVAQRFSVDTHKHDLECDMLIAFQCLPVSLKPETPACWRGT